ncbi:MAG TPA: hypothetical protein VKU37_03420 [Verrucomicrobiae bacterium]|nr:hypothetical protein [Verrucomicrobiae bacterium]
MKRIFAAIILTIALSLQAAAPPRGSNQLHELVVFPEMNLSFSFGINFQCGEWVVTKNTDTSVEISKLREELKRRPDNVEQFLQLGNLLDNNGETNESRVCYQKAEQLCRSRITARPQDGLVLTELGKSLWQLDNNEEAESVYRKAVLVSSNEWRCWVGLGNFLATESFPLMFPDNLRSQVTPSPLPPAQQILAYRPLPEALRQAEVSRDEASRCFDQAMKLAPGEPEVFFQRAGFMCVSNWQNCFFRHYRNDEEISSSQWLSAFFSPETIANLQKATGLSSKNYELISIAAYFEWIRALIQANWPTNYTVEMMPEKIRHSIHGAMTRLEDLSDNSDKKTAAGAFENLGFLNMTFGNNQVATTDFRRAVKLDPTREASWDLLLGTMLNSMASPEEIVSVCESHLKYENSARNHLLLAKALVREEKWNEGVAQAEIAGNQEPNNVVPSLLIAAIALKQSEQGNNLSIARTNLAHANIIIQKMPEGDEKKERTREWGLNTIIFYVLNNQLDWAKHTANEFLKLFPDDETAKEILKDLSAS